MQAHVTPIPKTPCPLPGEYVIAKLQVILNEAQRSEEFRKHILSVIYLIKKTPTTFTEEYVKINPHETHWYGAGFGYRVTESFIPGHGKPCPFIQDDEQINLLVGGGTKKRDPGWISFVIR